MQNRYIIYMALIAYLFINTGCNKSTVDPTPDPLQVQLEKLMNGNSSWGIKGGSVVKDGYDVTSQFSGFTLTLGEFTYTTQNSLASAWASSGTWQFSNNDPNKIMRKDGVLIDITLNNNQLILKFNVSGLTGGRVTGINGYYTFTLTGN